ncbi:MAG: glycosyltransferase [Planctomycetota bacterium]|nr:glycosyltransferase [Planctomycetota bacterium]
MASTPETSVLIPTYDQPALLIETLESVFAQTYTDYEIVIVDDGSPPSTRDALRPFLDRLVYVRKERGGIGSAKNAGLARCKGRFVAFLDHDDIWAREKLLVQIGALKEEPKYRVSYCRYEVTGTRDRPARTRPRKGYSGMILDRLMERTLVRTSSCLVVEREILRNIGPFREDLRVADDYEMLLRLAARHPFLFVDRVLLSYRQHAGAASADEVAKARDMAEILREWDDAPELSPAGRSALRRRLGLHLARLGQMEIRRGSLLAALRLVGEGIRLRPTRAPAFLVDLFRF